MPKQYKYFVSICSGSTHNDHARLIVTLDHPINETDLQEIEKSSYTKIFLSRESYVITNYKLLKVIGDFTYNVVYQKLEFGQWITHSQIYIQDHKLTSTSIKSDYRKFIAFLYPSNGAIAPKEWSNDFTRIILFQEIPDE